VSGAPPARGARLRWTAAGAAVGALLLVAVVLSLRPLEFRPFEGEAMATRWQVVLPDRSAAPAAADACFAELRRLDAELSEWQEGSPLAAVNRTAGVKPVAVPTELFDLLERSLELGRATNGAFDVAWAALWGLWDFRAASPRVPADEEIAARLPLVDFRRVVLDPKAHTVFLPERGMKLGLGAIGKGFALERVAALLEARGFHDFLVLGGGQVLARGRHGDRPWRVGVRDPRGERDEIFARLDLGDASLSTSADNEAFFVRDGVRYHHILDPRTGKPARGLRSATVLHRDATLADALSTAVVVLGRERGFEVVRRYGGEAVTVDDHGEVATTPGLAGRLEILHPPRRDD
jgi:thiamine biosynthesis lipoprotein